MSVRRATHGHAFSLIEVVVSVLIVGGLAVAVLNTMGATAARRRIDADRARGISLAQDLIDEISAAAYEDPGGADLSFGRGADETGTGDRSLFDDVDDYDGWSASPPQLRDGTPMTGFDGWTRSVVVRWADPAVLDADDAAESGLKRIVVRVHRGGRLVASMTTLRTSAMDASR
jgi:MSHA pilin protein MshD